MFDRGSIMVPAAGVEPATFRSGGERSNPLSYAGLNKMACFKETNHECPPFLTLLSPLVNDGLRIIRKDRMLITDQVATAPCTDCIQYSFLTFEAKPSSTHSQLVISFLRRH